MTGSRRRRSTCPLPNPYDLARPPGSGTPTWASAALVTATAAGLVVLGAGTAAADPDEGDTDSGFGISDLGPDVLAPAEPGGPPGAGVDDVALPPFSPEPDADTAYEIDDDVSLPPLTPPDATLDDPTPDSSLPPAGPADVVAPFQPEAERVIDVQVGAATGQSSSPDDRDPLAVPDPPAQADPTAEAPDPDPAEPPEPGEGRTEGELLAEYWTGTNNFSPSSGWSRFDPPRDVSGSPDAVRYQWRVGDDGVGDFVRIPDFAPPTGEPAVMIEPSAEGPTFSVIGRPGDPQGPWLDVDTSTIQPDGSGRNWVVDSEGGTSSIPQTNRALTLSEGEQFDQQKILRHLGTEGTFTVPAQDGQPLRFALDLPSLDDEPGTILQPRPGEAMLNCHVGDACYTFDDAGNVAVTRNGVDAHGRPVTTREYRVTETPNPLPDGLGTPSVTWLFVPGENGGNGSFTAFPGIGDSTDAATTALQVHRDDAGRVLWAEVAGGSSATDPAELDPLDVRDPGDITPPDPRSWRGLHFDMAEPLSVRHATGPNWDLSIPIDRVDREERLVGSVNGVPVGPFDDATGRTFAGLTRIPPLANPANVEVDSRLEQTPVMLSYSTDPEPIWIGSDNSLRWTTDEGETYRLDPYDYEPPTEPGGVAVGTGTYRLQPGDGTWERVDPATVPTVIGLWRGGEPDLGRGGGGPDSDDGGPDRGWGDDRQPSGLPGDDSGSPVLDPDGSPARTARWAAEASGTSPADGATTEGAAASSTEQVLGSRSGAVVPAAQPGEAGSAGQGGQVVAPERSQESGLEPNPGSRQSEGTPVPPPGLTPPRSERWEVPPLEEPVAPTPPRHTGQSRDQDPGLEMPVTRFPRASERDRLPTRPPRVVPQRPAGGRVVAVLPVVVAPTSARRTGAGGAGGAPEPVVQRSSTSVGSPALSGDPGRDRRRGPTAGDLGSNPERLLNLGPAPEPASQAGSGSNPVRDPLTGPVTMQRLPDGGYRAVGGLGGQLGVGYDAVYDRSRNLVSTSRGTAPATINTGQYLDPTTGAVAAGVAALTLLVPPAGLLGTSGLGTSGLGAGGVGMAGTIVPMLPGTDPTLARGPDQERNQSRGARMVTDPVVTRLGRPVCSPALQQHCVRPGSWNPNNPNSVGTWIAGPKTVGPGVPGHPAYDRLVAQGRAGDQSRPGMTGYGQGPAGIGLKGQRFIGNGSGTPQDQAATTVNNLASGYTINQAVDQAGRKLQDEVRRNGLLNTILKGATGIFR